jgi:hypothetical protein
MTSRRTGLAALGLALAMAGCTQDGGTPPGVDRAGHVSASTSPSTAVPTEPPPSPVPSRSAQGLPTGRHTVDTGGPTRREVRRAR